MIMTEIIVGNFYILFQVIRNWKEQSPGRSKYSYNICRKSSTMLMQVIHGFLTKFSGISVELFCRFVFFFSMKHLRETSPLLADINFIQAHFQFSPLDYPAAGVEFGCSEKFYDELTAKITVDMNVFHLLCFLQKLMDLRLQCNFFCPQYRSAFFYLNIFFLCQSTLKEIRNKLKYLWEFTRYAFVLYLNSCPVITLWRQYFKIQEK